MGDDYLLDLQDQDELSVPAGHEELLLELRPLLRDCPGCLPLLLPRLGCGLEDVPSLLQLVAARHPLLHPHLLLRRDQEVHPQEKEGDHWPRLLDREGDLLLNSLKQIDVKQLKAASKDVYNMMQIPYLYLNHVYSIE